MRTIPHQELRNNSSAILRDVRAGESIEITDHGEVARHC
ncbi:MAG: type II toxin-antitoxin system Phd/YefM family antitoxin [Sciscionella sp.]